MWASGRQERGRQLADRMLVASMSRVEQIRRRESGPQAACCLPAEWDLPEEWNLPEERCLLAASWSPEESCSLEALCWRALCWWPQRCQLTALHLPPSRWESPQPGGQRALPSVRMSAQQASGSISPASWRHHALRV